MGDIAEDVYRVDGVGLPYYVCTLLIRRFLEFQASLFQGAYHSSGSALRWLHETSMAGATACIDPSLLDDKSKGATSMTLKEFEDWLEHYDRQEVRLRRRKILKSFGLPADDLSNLYSDLCKYIHLSKVSFDKGLDWPKLQYIPEKFGEIFELTKRTLDVVLWMESRMLSCYDAATTKALKGFVRGLASLGKYVPLTVALISSLS